MTEYKEAQIIKHALQYYINRPDAEEKDIETEKLLLHQFEEKVERLKCRNHIS
ncbi:hypothetical protein [Acetobacterium paludosum]|uniref:hypothetical protein n=1 Tax=Acetobacterium paludosum TaxID=52693 RepID=UPI001478AFA7|nr:hypothetical protein [Acetobacterium paludosum]